MKKAVFLNGATVTSATLEDSLLNTPQVSSNDLNAPLFADLTTNAPKLKSFTSNTPSYFNVELSYALWFTFDDPNFFRDLATLFDVIDPVITKKRPLDIVGLLDSPRKRLPFESYDDFFYLGEERFSVELRRGAPVEYVYAIAPAILSTAQRYLREIAISSDYLSKHFDTDAILEDLFTSEDFQKIQRHRRKPEEYIDLATSSVILNGRQENYLEYIGSQHDEYLKTGLSATEELFTTIEKLLELRGNPRERVFFEDSLFSFNGDIKFFVDKLFASDPERKEVGLKSIPELISASFYNRSQTSITQQGFFDVSIDYNPKRLLETVSHRDSAFTFGNTNFFKDDISSTELYNLTSRNQMFDYGFVEDNTNYKSGLSKEEIVEIAQSVLTAQNPVFLKDNPLVNDALITRGSELTLLIPRLYEDFSYDNYIWKTKRPTDYPQSFKDYWREAYSWDDSSNASFPGRPEDRAGFMSGDEGRILNEGATSGAASGPNFPRYIWSNVNYGSPYYNELEYYRWYTNSDLKQTSHHDSGGRRNTLYLRTPRSGELSTGENNIPRQNRHWTGPTYLETLLNSSNATIRRIAENLGLVAIHPKQNKYDRVTSYSGDLVSNKTLDSLFHDVGITSFVDRNQNAEVVDVVFNSSFGRTDNVGVQSIFKNEYKYTAYDTFVYDEGDTLVLNGRQNQVRDKFDAADNLDSAQLEKNIWTHFDFFDAEGSTPPLSFEYGQSWYELVHPRTGPSYVRLDFVNQEQEDQYWEDLQGFIHTVFAKDYAPSKRQSRQAPQDLFTGTDASFVTGGRHSYLKDTANTIDNGIVKTAYKKDLAIPELWVYKCVENCGPFDGTPIYGWVDENALISNEELIRYSDLFYRKVDFRRTDFSDSVQHADSGTAFVEIYCSEAWSLESYVGEDGTHAAF